MVHLNSDGRYTVDSVDITEGFPIKRTVVDLMGANDPMSSDSALAPLETKYRKDAKASFIFLARLF